MKTKKHKRFRNKTSKIYFIFSNLANCPSTKSIKRTKPINKYPKIIKSYLIGDNKNALPIRINEKINKIKPNKSSKFADILNR